MKRKKLIKLIILLLLLFITTISISSIYIKKTYNESIFEYLFKPTETKLKKIGYSSDECNIILTLNNDTISEILNREYDSNLVKLINNSNFKEENTISYLEEINKSNLSIENTIFLVNHEDYDSTISYNDSIVSILKEPYYLSRNLNRYINYLNNNLSTTKTVAIVNANHDYEPYTNTKKTDITYTYQMLVNKYYYLDETYVPSLTTISTKYGRSQVQVEKKAYEQFIKMFNDAKENNLTLYINSAYRSYEEQESVFKEYEEIMKDKVLDYAAKPGYSEHQTGLALDIFKPGTTTKTFETTDEFKWLSENAYKYGFILRYPKDKEDITGYSYESWHYRYVGVDVATKIHDEDITFDEYYAYYLN